MTQEWCRTCFDLVCVCQSGNRTRNHDEIFETSLVRSSALFVIVNVCMFAYCVGVCVCTCKNVSVYCEIVKRMASVSNGLLSILYLILFNLYIWSICPAWNLLVVFFPFGCDYFLHGFYCFYISFSVAKYLFQYCLKILNLYHLEILTRNLTFYSHLKGKNCPKRIHSSYTSC